MVKRQNARTMKKTLVYEILFFKESKGTMRHNYEIYFDSDMKEDYMKLLPN
jgi:hypothetical protein